MRQTALLTGVLLACGSAFAADPQLVNLVMPDAKVLAGVNATTARISPLGQFVISKVVLANGDWQKFTSVAGFDPFQDVAEVLVASAAVPGEPGGLVMARGNFPVDKFVALVKTHGADAEVQTYGPATLISTSNPKEKIAHAVAFLGNTIAIAGDLASVKGAVDRSSKANSLDPALALKVDQLSASQDEWLVSSAPVASLIPANANTDAAKGPAAQALPLLKTIQSFNGGFKFTDNVVLTGEAVTSDPKNAAALNAVIKLGVILLASSSQNDAHVAQLVQLLNTLDVKTNGAAVDLSLSIPEAQIEGLVNSAASHTKVAAQVRPGRAVRNGN